MCGAVKGQKEKRKKKKGKRKKAKGKRQKEGRLNGKR
jgi:hypothetical protein